MDDPNVVEDPTLNIDVEGLLQELEIDEKAAEGPVIAEVPDAVSSFLAPAASTDPIAALETSAVPAVPAASAASAASEDSGASQLSGSIIQHFGDIQLKIWNQVTDDRAMLDMYIDFFKGRVDNEDTCKQYYVEALTSLISTKAATSANASKLLDSCAKMAAAIKSMQAADVGGHTILMNLMDANSGDGVVFDPDNP